MKIGIITDIHENVEMLEKALNQADKHACDALACLGDMVGYDYRFHLYSSSRSAKRCLAHIRSHCHWVVAGNHDLFAARKFPAFTNGFSFPPNWFDLDASGRKLISQGKVWNFEGEAPNDLDADDIAYISSLPEFITIETNKGSCLFSHYLFPDFSGSTTQYIEKNWQLKEQWKFMGDHKITFSFCGHAHTPFAEFAYPGKRSLFKAINSIPLQEIKLGDERVAVLLPPLSGDKGKSGFSIFDTESRQLSIIYLV